MAPVEARIEATGRARAVGSRADGGRRSTAEVVPRRGLMTPKLVHRARQRTPRLAELDHARLQIAERALDKAVLLLVVGQEVVPQGVLHAC